MSVLLAFTAATLFSLGTWLLLQRRLTRIVIGIGPDRTWNQYLADHVRWWWGDPAGHWKG